jgi:hypothetical protein
LGDKGAEIVAKAVRNCYSLVSLNMASNVIANAGLKVVFEELSHNQTLCELNVSTIGGKSRNTITTTGIQAMHHFCLEQKTCTIVNLSQISLEDEGLRHILRTLGSTAKRVAKTLNRNAEKEINELERLKDDVDRTKDPHLRRMYDIRKRPDMQLPTKQPDCESAV